MIHSLSMPWGRIHAEMEGSGEPIVFVHADFVDGRLWDDVRSLLAPAFTTIAYDKVGYGRSAPAQGPIVRRRELEAVLDRLGLKSVHLVGCSAGGTQALDFTLEHPDRVRSLTLVNGVPSGFVPEGPPPELLMTMFEAFEQGDVDRASELQVQIWFDGPSRRSDLSPARREARRLCGNMNRIFVERRTYLIADAATADPLVPPAVERLSDLSVPTLIVDGTLDWPENRRASRVLEQIPGARRVEMNAAHVPSLEDPRRFAEVLARFIREVP